MWPDPQGTEHATYTIITTNSNYLVAPVHDRMPVILQREDEARWLSGSFPAAAGLRAILVTCPAGQMEMYPVDSRVNNPDVDGETLIRPLTTIV